MSKAPSLVLTLLLFSLIPRNALAEQIEATQKKYIQYHLGSSLPNANTVKARNNLSLVKIESGFKFCCGNDSLRIYYRCSDGTKRCYKMVNGDWAWTFGSECDQQIHSCYVSNCSC